MHNNGTKHSYSVATRIHNAEYTLQLHSTNFSMYCPTNNLYILDYQNLHCNLKPVRMNEKVSITRW